MIDPERWVRRFDEIQQDRRWLAQPVGAVRKYADDRGSAFAGLVTFQVFLGMLPLLVVVLTALARLGEGSDRWRSAILESTLAQFPVVGSRIENDVSALAADEAWVVVSLLGLLWTAAGIYHSTQLSLNQVWNVQGVRRQGFVSRHVRALVLFTFVIAAAIGAAFLPGDRVGAILPDVVSVPMLAMAGWLFSAVTLLGVFRIAISPAVSLRDLVPAAVLAGLLWSIVQAAGSWIVGTRLAEAGDLYGGIGFVVVTLFWINLLARALLFANEWTVVRLRELWPRRIAQPPLTDADRRALTLLARNERRRPEEEIEVRFEGERSQG